METLTSSGYKLFERLKKLRLEIAREENMPPYIIFSDKTLIDMAAKKPSSEQLGDGCHRKNQLQMNIGIEHLSAHAHG